MSEKVHFYLITYTIQKNIL